MNGQYGNGLVMNFPVKDLLAKLTENREKHVKMVAEAKVNYIEALKKELEAKLVQLKAGKRISTSSQLDVPGDNTAEYDTAISMLAMTTDTTIKLQQDQYHSYVMDKWSWKSRFLASASNYSKLANDELVGAPGHAVE